MEFRRVLFRSIRVSRSLRDTAYKALKAREKLIQKNAKDPTSMEVAEEMGVSHEDIDFALDEIQDPVSLHEPIYNDKGDPIYVMDQIIDVDEKDEHCDDYL